MKALHPFIAIISISSTLLLQRARRAWKQQQALQELKHRNIFFHPLAFHGKKKTKTKKPLPKMLSPMITAKMITVKMA